MTLINPIELQFYQTIAEINLSYAIMHQNWDLYFQTHLFYQLLTRKIIEKYLN